MKFWKGVWRGSITSPYGLNETARMSEEDILGVRTF
jgi:hypothetical protein